MFSNITRIALFRLCEISNKKIKKGKLNITVCILQLLVQGMLD